MRCQMINSTIKGFILLLLQFFCIGSLGSQDITIQGTEPHYSGVEISFYTFNERITFSKKEVGRCTIDEKGNFYVNFQSKNTVQVFADLGKYQVYIYVVPGGKYKVKFPPRNDKTIADRLNPYFRPNQIHLGIVGSDQNDMNGKIAKFDATFEPIFQKYAFKAYLQTHFSDLDSTMQELDESFGDDTEIYFQCYVKFKMALLKEMSAKKKTEITIPQGNFPANILIHNPGFGEWFDQVYRNYFQYLVTLDREKYPLHEIIDSKRDDTALREILRNVSVIPNDTINELILLKGLYDEYFSNEFDKNAVLELFDSLINRSPSFEHKELARKIMYKITRLNEGAIPPGFELITFDGDTCNLSDLHGKYVYLNFCTSLSYPCLNNFNLLKSLNEKYADKLEIVTISVDEDNHRINELIQTRDYKWKFLKLGDQSLVLEDYDIRAYPTYFLINPKGKLVLSPAPGPDKEFEKIFVGILKSSEGSVF